MKKSSIKKTKQSESGIRLPSETIHVENNLIIDWLLKIKAIIRENQKFFKNIMISTIVALVVSGIIIFIYTSLAKKHNYLFFTYLNQYQEFKDIKPEAQKKEKLEKLIEDTHKLCHVFLKTPHSYNACLIEAVSYIELDQSEKASTPLDLFSKYNANNGAGAYALFFAAQAYESLFNYERAYDLYNELEELLKPIKQDDIAVFHKGKVLLLQNQLDLAEKNVLSYYRRFL